MLPSVKQELTGLLQEQLFDIPKNTGIRPPVKAKGNLPLKNLVCIHIALTVQGVGIAKAQGQQSHAIWLLVALAAPQRMLEHNTPPAQRAQLTLFAPWTSFLCEHPEKAGKGAAKKMKRREKPLLKTMDVRKKHSPHSHLSVTALGYSREEKGRNEICLRIN